MSGNTTAISLRPAHAEDCDDVLPMIYSAGPEQLEYVFTQPGKLAQAFLASAFRSGAGMFGYHIYTVALADQRPVAIGASYDRREGKVFERQVLFQVLRFYGLRYTWPVLKRAMQLDAVIPFPEPGVRYIAQVGVAEAMQGRGVGTAWLQNQITLARQQGYVRCALDVATSNPRAQALYERLGFTVTAERAWPKSAAHNRMPDVRHMELGLS